MAEFETDVLTLTGPEKRVRTITIDRGDALNAINEPVLAALEQALDRLEDDTSTRAVIVRGAGGTFSAGADLSWLQHVDTE